MKTLYVQDAWDEAGDLVFSCWTRGHSFLTYNHRYVHEYAKQKKLEIKWLTN